MSQNETQGQEGSVEKSNVSGPQDASMEERQQLIEEGRRAGNPDAIGNAIQGGVPVAPNFRDPRLSGHNIVGGPDSERERYQLEDQAFNRPGEKPTTEDDVKAAQAQHELAKEAAQRRRGGDPEKPAESVSDTSGAGGVSRAINPGGGSEESDDADNYGGTFEDTTNA